MFSWEEPKDISENISNITKGSYKFSKFFVFSWQSPKVRKNTRKTRYSGHLYSRLLRDLTQHDQTDPYSYYMGGELNRLKTLVGRPFLGCKMDCKVYTLLDSLVPAMQQKPRLVV